MPSLNADQPLTLHARSLGITTWDALLRYVHRVPYGRNANRTDVALVFTEHRGTCSSKHALLAAIAAENEIPDIALICGIYKMNATNTQGIGEILAAKDLPYIPEAHCYLLCHGKRIDLTFLSSDISRLEPDIITEITLSPQQVGQFKIDFHQAFIRTWIAAELPGRSFDEIWSTREQCIARLAELNP